MFFWIGSNVFFECKPSITIFGFFKFFKVGSDIEMPTFNFKFIEPIISEIHFFCFDYIKKENLMFFLLVLFVSFA